MFFRLASSAAAAVLAIAALTVAVNAADTGNGASAPRHRFRMEYGGYYGRIGGHFYGVVPERDPFKNESVYNYPGYLNNQTFWERVQTQRNYPVQY